jgi:hypothetical protein
VEYYDENPCQPKVYAMATDSGIQLEERAMAGAPTAVRRDKVKIEARYLVGEYDILILSAEESTALKTWLDNNGYKIPKGAEEVLEPYIKRNFLW